MSKVNLFRRKVLADTSAATGKADLAERVIITGGARGIGFGIATAMLDAGYDVTVTGLSDEEVAAVPQAGVFRPSSSMSPARSLSRKCWLGLTNLPR